MGRPFTLEQRQSYAISKARERRRAELTPVRKQVDHAITRLGWRRARPIVSEVMGFPLRSQRGAWWSRVGKRNGAKLLEALAEARRRPPVGQLSLFGDGPEAA
jgi:hypothetical protein